MKFALYKTPGRRTRFYMMSPVQDGSAHVRKTLALFSNSCRKWWSRYYIQSMVLTLHYKHTQQFECRCYDSRRNISDIFLQCLSPPQWDMITASSIWALWGAAVRHVIKHRYIFQWWIGSGPQLQGRKWHNSCWNRTDLEGLLIRTRCVSGGTSQWECSQKKSNTFTQGLFVFFLPVSFPPWNWCDHIFKLIMSSC